MKKKKSALLTTALIAIIVGVAAASVLYHYQVSNNGNVQTSYNLLLTTDGWYQDGSLQAVTSIDWGEFLASGEERRINHEDVLINSIDIEPPSEKDLIIKNVGNMPIYVAWEVTDLSDSSITITAKYESSYMSGTWMAWDQNVFSSVIEPQEILGRIIFQVTTTSATTPGAFSFTLNFYSADSPSG